MNTAGIDSYDKKIRDSAYDDGLREGRALGRAEVRQALREQTAEHDPECVCSGCTVLRGPRP